MRKAKDETILTSADQTLLSRAALNDGDASARSAGFAGTRRNCVLISKWADGIECPPWASERDGDDPFPRGSLDTG